MKTDQFNKVVQILQERFPDEYEEALSFDDVARPKSADTYAKRIIYVICASGFKASTAKTISAKCTRALRQGKSAHTVFGHAGKAEAIDHVWQKRQEYFKRLKQYDEVSDFEELPYIGRITKYHLAKNCGWDVIKPDVHLVRLAQHYGVTPKALCAELSAASGHKKVAIDSILWEACRNRILSPATGQISSAFLS